MIPEMTRRTFLETGAAALAVGTSPEATHAEAGGSPDPKVMRWEAGKNTHENIVFACSGGMSNAGIITMLASLEVVKELGLQKVCLGCLPAAPNKKTTMAAVAQAARRVIVVDGCPMKCAREMVEGVGLKPTRHFVLTRDIHLKKKVFREEIGGELKGVMEYIAATDVKKAKDLITRAVSETS